MTKQMHSKGDKRKLQECSLVVPPCFRVCAKALLAAAWFSPGFFQISSIHSICCGGDITQHTQGGKDRPDTFHKGSYHHWHQGQMRSVDRRASSWNQFGILQIKLSILPIWFCLFISQVSVYAISEKWKIFWMALKPSLGYIKK